MNQVRRLQFSIWVAWILIQAVVVVGLVRDVSQDDRNGNAQQECEMKHNYDSEGIFGGGGERKGTISYDLKM